MTRLYLYDDAAARAFEPFALTRPVGELRAGAALLRRRWEAALGAPAAAAIVRSRRAFVQGLVSTVLNPKPALFFLTFLPQFVDRDAPVLPQTLTLAGIHVVVGLIWLSAYARLVQRARGLLTAPRVRTWLERTTGVVLIAFGLRVAVERR